MATTKKEISLVVDADNGTSNNPGNGDMADGDMANGDIANDATAGTAKPHRAKALHFERFFADKGMSHEQAVISAS